jgi:hypothetical protein
MKSTSNFDGIGQTLELSRKAGETTKADLYMRVAPRLQHSSFRKDKMFLMAYEVALSEHDKTSRNEVLGHVAVRCAENKFLPAALQIVKVIHDRVERAGALAEVSVKSIPRVPWKRHCISFGAQST